MFFGGILDFFVEICSNQSFCVSRFYGEVVGKSFVDMGLSG